MSTPENTPAAVLTADDIRAELSDLGRALFDQAIESATRAKQLRAELARLSNAAHTPTEQP